MQCILWMCASNKNNFKKTKNKLMKEVANWHSLDVYHNCEWNNMVLTIQQAPWTSENREWQHGNWLGIFLDTNFECHCLVTLSPSGPRCALATIPDATALQDFVNSTGCGIVFPLINLSWFSPWQIKARVWLSYSSGTDRVVATNELLLRPLTLRLAMILKHQVSLLSCSFSTVDEFKNQ